MRKRRLLLVDDDPDLALIVRVLSRQMGHELQWRSDCPTALKLLESELFDLLLLDINLTGASGLEVLRRLRAHPEPSRARLPVALFSQPELTEDLAAGWEAGATFLLAKNLVTSADQWNMRLEAILEHMPGPLAPSSIASSVGSISAELLADLNGMLSRVVLPKTGSNLLGAMLRRATQQQLSGQGGWEVHDGRLAMAADRLAAVARESLRRVCRSLVEQTWCLFGPELSGRLETTLAGLFAPREKQHALPVGGGGMRREADVCGRDVSLRQADVMKTARAILLVEDNPADVKITQRAVRECRLDVELIVMRDGQEAIDYLLRQGPYAGSPGRLPDVILLDLNLPRLSGQEVLERVRATPPLRNVPVVVLTTSTRQEDITRMYNAGANTYIEKPQDFNRFVQVLQTIHRYWLDTALLPPRGE